MGISADQEQRRDAFAERLLGAVVGAFDVYAVYLGGRLGLYQALSEGDFATPAAVAERAGCHERYVREWLEQQAVTGILAVEDVAADPASRRYALPAEYAEVLLDADSQNWLAPLAQLFVGAASALPALRAAYRTGSGVPYADYGQDLRDGQAGINRPAFLQLLPDEWLPGMPDVDTRLRADPPARVADIGCGAGWSCIGIARGYPKARVDGFDLDEASVALAQQNIVEASLGERVRVELRDAGDPALARQYDLVTAFECVHDMGRPVDALRTMRRLLAPGGCALVVDERVAGAFAAPGDEIERMMYGWSILRCLPAGMADVPSVGTGTVMRPATLRGYAEEAGFSGMEILLIDHLFFRFYRLVP